MPLAAPGVFTTAILTFFFCWNDFLFAISLTSTDRARTVPAALVVLHRARRSSSRRSPRSWPAAVVVTIPIIIIVLLFQRRIVAGLTPAPSRAEPREHDPWPADHRCQNIVKQLRRRVPRGQRREPRHRRRRVHDPRRPVGLREVDPAAHDRRPRGHHLGRHADRRRAGQRQGAPGPQPGDGVPELRPLPAPDGLREHRLPAAAAQAAVRGRDHGRRSTRRPRRSSSTEHLDRKPGNLSGGQRQRVAMGRAIVRERRRLPLRRAAVQPRRQAARPDAHRDPRACSSASASPRSTSPTTRPRP